MNNSAAPSPDGQALGAATEALETEALEPAEAEVSLADLGKRLGAIEDQLGEFHRRAAHREQVIDRLHEENRVLKQGMHRAVLEPVVTDLIRLHDGLSREASRIGEEDGLIGSFAAEVAEILDRCGIETFTATVGEAYQGSRHKPLGAVPTPDPDLHNTIAAGGAAGFYDRQARQVRRQAQARIYQYRAQGEN